MQVMHNAAPSSFVHFMQGTASNRSRFQLAQSHSAHRMCVAAPTSSIPHSSALIMLSNPPSHSGSTLSGPLGECLLGPLLFAESTCTSVRALCRALDQNRAPWAPLMGPKNAVPWRTLLLSQKNCLLAEPKCMHRALSHRALSPPRPQSQLREAPKYLPLCHPPAGV